MLLGILKTSRMFNGEVNPLLIDHTYSQPCSLLHKSQNGKHICACSYITLIFISDLWRWNADPLVLNSKTQCDLVTVNFSTFDLWCPSYHSRQSGFFQFFESTCSFLPWNLHRPREDGLFTLTLSFAGSIPPSACRAKGIPWRQISWLLPSVAWQPLSPLPSAFIVAASLCWEFGSWWKALGFQDPGTKVQLLHLFIWDLGRSLSLGWQSSLW